MIELNLPKFEYKLTRKENKLYIYDSIRKKKILLTPEEWVRQHFLHFMINEKYPKSLLKVEGGLKFNKRMKRTDIVAYDTFGNPFLVVECKSFDVKLNKKTIEQVVHYNQVKKAPFIAITNGIHHFYFQINQQSGMIESLERLPNFGQTF